MDTVELLAKFADPEVMKSLSLNQRLTAGLITTVLGMGITFLSLIILQFVISLMAKFSSGKGKEVQEPGAPGVDVDKPSANQEIMHDEEVVAAISTALALQLKTSVSKIVIKNIERVEESSTAWHKAGITEHMKN